MKTIFPIKEGTLEFFDDHIEIRDKWKSAQLISYIFPISSTLYPLALVFRPKHDDLWTFGVVLLVMWTLLLSFKLFNPKKTIYLSQLQIDQIDSIILERYSYDKLSAKFILKNRKRRLVNLDFDRFWRADFEEALAARNIECVLI
jgi:hypothetical protein